ncbi:MAG: phosphoglycerate dehydrogenase [Alphaproteobacteria bacterium]|nr:phosphoglycerate dehydrogenase [Alphaproteobacteria bacterium]
MPKVLISDALSPAAVKIFQERGVEVDQKNGLKPEELKEIIGQYDGLAIRSNTKVTKDILAAATKLKVVGRAGIGVDNVDVPAATARGVIVMNTPFGNSITTAEHAIALLFAVARQIPAASASTHAGKWEKNKFMGVELYGKTLGVIGCGNIGAIVADRALGLKMKVAAFDPFLSVDRAQQLGVEKVELDELLRRADFITLHTPLTEQTKGILNAAAIAKCKKGVRIINCARGGLVDELALRAALESGHVAGAGFDVFSEEPAKTNPLFGIENVVCTPHLGAATNEAQENVALQVAEQISDYLMTGAVVNALNMPSVSAEDAPKLRPYMKLAEQLGSLAGQTVETGVKAVTIEYEGQVAGVNTKPLTAIALMGLLKPLMESVNMVNAPIIAKERNIALSETRRDRAADYQTLIRITVESESGKRVVAGTVVAGEKPRIINIDGVALEAELTPYMLFVQNEDQPGFIGRLGTKLGQAGVNIANFNLGRDHAGGKALSLVGIDAAMPDVLLEELNKLPSVVRATALAF